MLPDLTGLKAFGAVVEHGGFARAAEHLHKVQSAVSHQVAKLEEQLGVALFNRDGYRVRLTPAGAAVLAESRRLLAQAQHIHSLARQFAQGWEPMLLVIVDGILPLDPLLMALRAMSDEQVPTRIQVKVELLRDVQSRFERDSGDFMLAAQSDPAPYLHEEVLPQMDCVLCTAAGHPLAAARSVSLAQLQEHVELSVQGSSEDQGANRYLFGCERSIYVSSFQTKKEALLMGVGFGWMPLYLVRDELRAGTLREVQYAGGSRFTFTPRLVHRTDRPLGRAGRRLFSLLQAAQWPQSAPGPAMAAVAQPRRRRPTMQRPRKS